MNRATKTAGSILTLGIFLVAFNLGGSAGCGGDAAGGGGGTGADDDTVTATDEDADAAFSAASAAVSAALTSATGAGLTVQGSVKLSEAVGSLKNAITVGTASSCDEGNVPSPTGDSVTVQGSDIFTGGSGSCAVSWDEGTDTFDILLDCADLSDGTVNLDGSLGFEAAVSDSNFSLDIGSQDFTATLGGDVCSFVANLGIDIDSNTITVSGCLGLCGEFFSISGSETF